MIDVVLKTGLIFVLFVIFFQDIKDRLVIWFLYPTVGLLGYMVQSSYIGYELSKLYSLMNLTLVLIVLLILFLYSKYKLKMTFADGSMGWGDILLLTCLSFTFPTVTFVVLFVFSLFFSLIVHFILKNKSVHKTVPLAGYISIFFAVVYIASFILAPKYLFS